jgi:hypothetical protein
MALRHFQPYRIEPTKAARDDERTVVRKPQAGVATNYKIPLSKDFLDAAKRNVDPKDRLPAAFPQFVRIRKA